MTQATASSNRRLDDLHHLGLTVADIERSIAFYRDLLGMTLHRRRPNVDNDYVALQTGYPGVSRTTWAESHRAIWLRRLAVDRGEQSRRTLVEVVRGP